MRLPALLGALARRRRLDIPEECRGRPPATQLERLIWMCACRGKCGSRKITEFTVDELLRVGDEEMLQQLLRCLLTREHGRSTSVVVHVERVKQDDARDLGECLCTDGTRYSLNCRERSITVEYAGRKIRLWIRDA